MFTGVVKLHDMPFCQKQDVTHIHENQFNVCKVCRNDDKEQISL